MAEFHKVLERLMADRGDDVPDDADEKPREALKNLPETAEDAAGASGGEASDFYVPASQDKAPGEAAGAEERPHGLAPVLERLREREAAEGAGSHVSAPPAPGVTSPAVPAVDLPAEPESSGTWAVPLDEVPSQPSLPVSAPSAVGASGDFPAWDEQLAETLKKTYPAAEAARIAVKYQVLLPGEYKAAAGAAEAIEDIRSLETLDATGRAQIELARVGPAEERAAVLKLYLAGERLVLSDILPALENFGLRVFSEDTIGLNLPSVGPTSLHRFFVQDAATPPADVADAAPHVVAALHAVRSGEAANDRLNTLVLRAGLQWRAVDLLRAYAKYSGQLAVSGHFATLVEALVAHPACGARLFDMFRAKFDPTAFPLPPAERLAGPVSDARQAFLAGLDRVESLRLDRALRSLAGAIDATVRTNFYAPSRKQGGVSATAIKVECARMSRLPSPRPLFETFVHGAGVSGIHLRVGRIARGGIRFSDRRDDFRLEILGLMQTQAVKNAVIVPVGAKGGFVLTRRAPGGTMPRAEVEDAYRMFIHALLSITDNIENVQVVSPRGLVVYDEPDPYLVVAADKGTASFSDLANAVAEKSRFWLGDAFASGGSHGYDHKAVGITARGAWECVRYHFRNLGIDPDREPIRVIGIGDMSGDVFGNGMLQSRSMRLCAAFNDKHIFIDPEPSSEASYWERQRLFRLPSSTWADYNPSVLSAGGGVFPRYAKRVSLSVQAQKLLGVEEEQMSGADLVRAVLRMEADLLWNGGVGTYVKSAGESHAEAADPGNDEVRVDAEELRVKVIAEGGNLGLTQRARVAFALRGGAVNTDAIDNAGGVALSDREVNLKIALQSSVVDGRLSVEERNKLLAGLTEETSKAVLAENRRQVVALGMDQLRSRADLPTFRDLMTMLEEEAGLDRKAECLPTREALRARRSTCLGLTRPELAVLLAYSKLDLQRRIIESSLPDEPVAERFLTTYFPDPINERFRSAVRGHCLRREIIAVALANCLIDAMGVTFLIRIKEDTGQDLIDVVRSWTAATVILESDEALQEFNAAPLDPAADAGMEFCGTLERASEQAVKWLLGTQDLPGSVSDVVERLLEPTQQVLANWPDLLAEEGRDAYAERVRHFVGFGLTEPLAEWICRIEVGAHAMEITHMATELKLPAEVVAETYLGCVRIVDFEWIRKNLTQLSGEDRWARRARHSLIEGLAEGRRHLTRDVLRCRPGGGTLDSCLAAYRNSHAAQVERILGLLDDVKAAPRPTMDMMLVVMRELGRLLDRQ